MPWLKSPTGAVKEFREREVLLRTRSGWEPCEAPPPPKKPHKPRRRLPAVTPSTTPPDAPTDPSSGAAAPDAPAAESGANTEEQ